MGACTSSSTRGGDPRAGGSATPPFAPAPAPAPVTAAAAAAPSTVARRHTHSTAHTTFNALLSSPSLVRGAHDHGDTDLPTRTPLRGYRAHPMRRALSAPDVGAAPSASTAAAVGATAAAAPRIDVRAMLQEQAAATRRAMDAVRHARLSSSSHGTAGGDPTAGSESSGGLPFLSLTTPPPRRRLNITGDADPVAPAGAADALASKGGGRDAGIDAAAPAPPLPSHSSTWRRRTQSACAETSYLDTPAAATDAATATRPPRLRSASSGALRALSTPAAAAASPATPPLPPSAHASPMLSLRPPTACRARAHSDGATPRAARGGGGGGGGGGSALPPRPGGLRGRQASDSDVHELPSLAVRLRSASGFA